MKLFREDVTKRIKDFDEKAMYCPFCLTKLKDDGYFRYEDVCGSTIGSTKWVCPSKGFLDPKTGTFKQCLCNKYEAFWNDDGDYFSGHAYEYYKEHKRNFEFIHGKDCYAAFNSFAKGVEVSIYAKGLKRRIDFHPAWCLWLLKPFIEFKYKSDKVGNILGITWKLKFLKKDRFFSTNYSVHYISGVKMLLFCFKTFRRNLKSYRDMPDNKFRFGQLQQNFEKRKWDKRWWRLIFYYSISALYPKLKKKVIENCKKV